MFFDLGVNKGINSLAHPSGYCGISSDLRFPQQICCFFLAFNLRVGALMCPLDVFMWGIFATVRQEVSDSVAKSHFTNC